MATLQDWFQAVYDNVRLFAMQATHRYRGSENTDAVARIAAGHDGSLQSRALKSLRERLDEETTGKVAWDEGAAQRIAGALNTLAMQKGGTAFGEVVVPMVSRFLEKTSSATAFKQVVEGFATAAGHHVNGKGSKAHKTDGG